MQHRRGRRRKVKVGTKVRAGMKRGLDGTMAWWQCEVYGSRGKFSRGAHWDSPPPRNPGDNSIE